MINQSSIIYQYLLTVLINCRIGIYSAPVAKAQPQRRGLGGEEWTGGLAPKVSSCGCWARRRWLLVDVCCYWFLVDGWLLFFYLLFCLLFGYWLLLVICCFLVVAVCYSFCLSFLVVGKVLRFITAISGFEITVFVVVDDVVLMLLLLLVVSAMMLVMIVVVVGGGSDGNGKHCCQQPLESLPNTQELQIAPKRSRKGDGVRLKNHPNCLV